MKETSHLLAFLFILSLVHYATAQRRPIEFLKPIIRSSFEVHVEKYAQIPDFGGRASRIVGIIRHGSSLFVTTSSSGGIIYRISKGRVVSKWFDVNQAMQRSTGRPMDFSNKVHGGLRGLAFHPNFNKNGLFYVSCMEDRLGQPVSNFKYFSRPGNPSEVIADSVVLEFRVNLATGKPIPKSLREVIRIGMPVFDHTVRQIAFLGNNLYITHGDGSVQSAQAGGGQNNDGLGKILRINPRRKGTKPYTVPSSNPFVGKPRFKSEIYALGFRNPHNLCFSKRGELFMVDVGRDNFEEINIVKPGKNYGWSQREGPFVHRTNQNDGKGLGTGIRPLPANDAIFKYEYPVAGLPHFGNLGVSFSGQAIAGSCPIENSSPMNNMMLYANFPTDGRLYFSKVGAMRKAVTNGNPRKLTMARTFQPRIFYDHDNNPSTPSVEVQNLRDIVRRDRGHEGAERVDLRFGQGKNGEIYWSSKTNGRIYLIRSSVPV